MNISRNILFLIPPGVHLLDVNGPAHVFFEAKRLGANVNLHFVSFNDTTEIESSAGLVFSKLTPYYQFELTDKDFVFVPGMDYELLSDKKFINNNRPFLDWLYKQYRNHVNICSICTGLFLLAESGILENNECTTHWRYANSFKQKYPEIKLIINRLFVVNKNLYTSAGVSSGIDLTLYIIEILYSSKFAADIAKEAVLYFRRSENDPQLNIYLRYRNHIDSRIHDAQDYMLKNLDSKINLIDIADNVNMSLRNLTRLFKKNTGITIGDYLEKLKLERALYLLSKKNKVESVAMQCGFKSTNQLRTLLKKHKNVLHDS